MEGQEGVDREAGVTGYGDDDELYLLSLQDEAEEDFGEGTAE